MASNEFEPKLGTLVEVSHTRAVEADAARVVEAVGASVKDLRDGGFIPAKRPKPRPVPRPVPAAGKVVSLNPDDLIVKLADDQSEIEQSQALRYRVFYEEMGAHPTAEMTRLRRDLDNFDEPCDHLLVIDRKRGDRKRGDRKRGEVVGTYRLLRSQAGRKQKFYSAGEFDISPLLALDEPILELGRACVAPEYRSGVVLRLLWQGIAEYVRRHRIGLMFGCASFPGTDPAKLGEPLSYLYHHHLAPPAIRVKALAHRYIDMQGTEVERIDRARVNAALPSIIRGYLRLGAFIGEGAVIDEQFNTIDVSVVLRPERALRAFAGATTARGATAARGATTVRSLPLAAGTAGREHTS